MRPYPARTSTADRASGVVESAPLDAAPFARHLGGRLGRRRSRVRLPAEIGLLHDGVGLHGGGITTGDDQAVVEHVDAGADLHHQRHVVLDQQDAHPFGRQLPEHLTEAMRLLRVETRARLVEQEDRG